MYSRFPAGQTTPRGNRAFEKGARFGRLLCSSAIVLLWFASPALSQADFTKQEIQKSEADQVQRNPIDQKIGSGLLDAWKQQSNTAGARKVTKKVDITTNENLNATVNAIKKLGAKIADFSNLGYPAGQGGITAYVPLNKLPDIAANPNVLKIDKAAQPSTNGARIDGEGRVAHEVDQASKLFKVDGSGIKIGIISDSIDNQDHPLRKAYATGAISKTSLHILHGQAGDMDNSAEGLAMAEIIHAIAPKASIYFAEGFTSETHMGTNIRALLQAGAE